MMNTKSFALINALWLVAIMAGGGQAQEPPSAYALTFPAMGTLMEFQAYSDDESTVNAAFKAAQLEVERLVEILSDYSTESETVLLSAPEKVGQWQKVSSELFEVLSVCDRWHQQSSGAFDASVGQLSILWRKARKSKTVPTPEQIAEARSKCGWSHVQLDSNNQRVRIDLKGLRLDFGALGKGYIIDKAYDKLAQLKLPCALVRAGGDLRLGEPPPARQGWPVEVAKLKDAEQPVQLYLARCAISSSGDLYQSITIDGVRRSHVLDPRTGIGVPGPRMVTVIAPTSVEADAADTAMCVMADDDALKLARELPALQVRLVTVIDNDRDSSTSLRIRTTEDFGKKPSN